MAANAGTVDVITNCDNAPSCEHGPSLLFSRYCPEKGTQRQFFACAAFRDHKACPFFRWADEVKTSNENREALWPVFDHKDLRRRFTNFIKLKLEERRMCVECGLLLLPGEQEFHEGLGHSLTSDISDDSLKSPTQLFKPLESNKTYAQYLFSQKTVDFVLDLLNVLKITDIVCIGCPRIHETIQAAGGTGGRCTTRSLLLDLDHRYLQVFPPANFCRYNMLNHHFFGKEEDMRTFRNFIKVQGGRKLAVLIDPPFGVMVDALLVTLDKIQKQWRKENGQRDSAELPVFWFFPYFMEHRVTGGNPKYTMLDYKVDYVNHGLFRDEKRSKKGSPVRIFTNIAPNLVKLPESEDYWFCEKCQRYRFADNKHCELCNTCPTKDGGTYRHCSKCSRCVKPSHNHCDNCNICEAKHKCGRPRGLGCHMCGDMGHKRRDCPKNRANKRKTEMLQNEAEEKKMKLQA